MTRLRSWIHPGPLVVLAALGLFALALGLRDWYWPRFGVAGSNGFGFLDMRSLTTAWECTRDGIDVLPANPCDPSGRPANYPRIWLWPADLGLGDGSTAWLGGATALVFLAAVLVVVGRCSSRDAVVYAAVLCSPSVMLGIERGNADLLVFAVVVAALLLLRRGTAGRVLAHALLLVAAMLKLFPVFAFGVLARQPRRWVLAGGGAVLGVFLLYVLVTLDDIRTIRDVVPQELLFSYGAGVLADGSLEYAATLVAGLAVAAALVGVAAPRTREPVREGFELDAFWAGAGIFVATFALFHNFNYRLAFLILVVPQLLRWLRAEHAAVPFAGVGLSALLASLWLGSSISFFPLGLGERWEDVAQEHSYDELANVVLWGYLVGAMLLTLPAGLTRLVPGMRTRPAPRAVAGRPRPGPQARTSARP